MNPPPRRPDDEPTPLSALPVAEPVGPDPMSAEVVRPDDLPVAVPVRPPAGRRRERPRPPAPPPEPVSADPPRPRVLAACSVIGCLGLGVVAAVGFLAYGAVLILSHLGERAAAPDPPAPAAAPPGPVAPAGREPAAPPAREPHGPIAPTKLGPPSAAVDIGGTVDAVVRAGGGRYLLFRLRGQNRVVAFDANSGAMVPGWEVKLGEPGSLIAGGKDRLWVYEPLSRELVRVNLRTGETERRAESDPGDGVEAVAAGAGSDGPVYLVGPGRRGTRVRMLGGITPGPVGAADYDGPLGEWLRARASDDGQVLTLSGRDGAAVGRAARGEGMDFKPLKSWDGFGPGPVAPAPDGRWVYSPRGVFTPTGRLALTPGTPREYFYTVPPADGGDFFLRQDVDARGHPGGPLYAHRAGDRNHVGPLKWVESPIRWDHLVGNWDIAPSERVFFWPGAGLAATLPDNATLHLQKVDVAALRAARGD